MQTHILHTYMCTHTHALTHITYIYIYIHPRTYTHMCAHTKCIHESTHACIHIVKPVSVTKAHTHSHSHTLTHTHTHTNVGLPGLFWQDSFDFFQIDTHHVMFIKRVQRRRYDSYYRRRHDSYTERDLAHITEGDMTHILLLQKWRYVYQKSRKKETWLILQKETWLILQKETWLIYYYKNWGHVWHRILPNTCRKKKKVSVMTLRLSLRRSLRNSFLSASSAQWWVPLFVGLVSFFWWGSLDV